MTKDTSKMTYEELQQYIIDELMKHGAVYGARAKPGSGNYSAYLGPLTKKKVIRPWHCTKCGDSFEKGEWAQVFHDELNIYCEHCSPERNELSIIDLTLRKLYDYVTRLENRLQLLIDANKNQLGMEPMYLRGQIDDLEYIIGEIKNEFALSKK